MLVTLVAVLGATGALPVDGASGPASAGEPFPGSTPAPSHEVAQDDAAAITLSGAVSAALPFDPYRGDFPAESPPVDTAGTASAASAASPDGSGEGKRVVFDISDQRVWLVNAKDKVRRTYLVSGSLTDNLGPGSYEVYSRSRHATGIDDSGTMQYMVRFTQGENAAIGFHDIPVRADKLVQTRAQLGSPQSHGCIRQAHPDAKQLWRFAPVGTSFVVLD